MLPFAGFGLGLLLLLGASVGSRVRFLWPAVAAALYAHRPELMAVGVGAIALAFLWLNVTVWF